MISNSTVFKTLFGMTAFVSALAAFIFWESDYRNFRALSDQNLKAEFYAHKTEFVSLRFLAAADMPYSAYLNASAANPKLTLDKNRKYKALMSQISPNLIVTMDYDTTTRFVFSTGGLSAIGPGWLKGIEYIPGDAERKGEIKSDLTDASKWPPNVYLREIEPHWFIVYQRDDD